MASKPRKEMKYEKLETKNNMMKKKRFLTYVTVSDEEYITVRVLIK